MEVEVREVAPGVHHARAKHVGWVLLEDGGEVTLVDSGYPGDRAAVLASVERIGRRPADVAAVLLTHGHPDHLGSAELFRAREGAAVHTHRSEVPNAMGLRVEQVSAGTLLRRVWRSDVRAFLLDIARLKAAKPERVQDVVVFDDGARLDVPGHPVALHTPGHTSGHCCFVLSETGVLLAGDALMTEHALARKKGPQLLPSFFATDPAQARASLERLREVAADVVVPGHGDAWRGSPAAAVELALR